MNAKLSPKVTFVVPVKNGEETLARCLQAIKCQTQQISSEILVIDNNSTDNSIKIAQTFGVQLFREQKQGRSHARNRGILESKGEWIAFIDCDVFLDKNWLENMNKDIVLQNLHGGQGRIIPSKENNSFFQEYRETFLNVQSEGSNCQLDSEQFIYPMINTAACLYKKSALIEVEGFSEDMKTHEDADLAWKLWMNGAVFGVSDSIAHVAWDKGLISYLLRSFKMGMGHANLNIQWSINTTFYFHRISGIKNFKIRYQIIEFIQTFCYMAGYTVASSQCKKTLNKHRLLKHRQIKMLSHEINNLIFLKPSLRYVWTQNFLIIKDCVTKFKIKLPRNSLPASQFQEIIELNTETLQNAGMLEIFKRPSSKILSN